MTVMIIDDAVTVRMMTKTFLQELGFTHIHLAENGIEALELLEDVESLDLVLVDWNMPYMNGVDFIQNLRAKPGFRDTKILMITTETAMEKVVQALEVGANEYMMKPFNKEMLTNKLQILGLDVPLCP
ncbi:MAG: response regulator [Candidatus Sericytochromatia bacterium]|nr:response regulator [Candidatus Sericytochromatia bacterium]